MMIFHPPPTDASFSQDALAEAEAKRVTWP